MGRGETKANMSKENTGNIAIGWGPFFQFYLSRNVCWFRIFGLGVAIKDIRRLGLMFSERHRLCWGRQFGRYYIKLLGRY